MGELACIGIAIPEELLEEFDRLIERRAQVYGAVTLLYDHHGRLLFDKLTDLQHQYNESVMSSVHVHLDR